MVSCRQLTFFIAHLKVIWPCLLSIEIIFPCLTGWTTFIYTLSGSVYAGELCPRCVCFIWFLRSLPLLNAEIFQNETRSCGWMRVYTHTKREAFDLIPNHSWSWSNEPTDMCSHCKFVLVESIWTFAFHYKKIAVITGSYSYFHGEAAIFFSSSPKYWKMMLI